MVITATQYSVRVIDSVWIFTQHPSHLPLGSSSKKKLSAG